MTDRDMKILELVAQCSVITREQVQKVLFKDTHINVPLRRLKKLCDDKYIKRSYFNLDAKVNSYVYYRGKKPSQRNLKHNLLITEFITNVYSMCEVLEVETNYRIGNIISDAYMKYRTCDGKTKHIFLEVQLSSKVSVTTDKYKDIRNIILDNKPSWNTVPNLIVITDLSHDNEQMKNIKILYDDTQMSNLREILF